MFQYSHKEFKNPVRIAFQRNHFLGLGGKTLAEAWCAEIDAYLLVSCGFDGFEFEEFACAVDLTFGRVIGYEIVHYPTIPCEEGGGVGVVVGIFDGDDSALIKAMEFALED